MNPSSRSASSRPHLVIIGAGFGGQAVARGLKKADIDITLIDKNNYQTFQPLLYQVATAELEPEEIVYPIRGSFRKQENVRFLMGTVADFDLSSKVIRMASGERLKYDYLTIAAGSKANFYGIPGAEQFSFPLKELHHSVWLRSHILKQFERAEQQPALLKYGLLNFVIAGGGPTGVETAGALIELIKDVLTQDYPKLPLDQVRVVLVEAGPAILGPFRKESQQHAKEALEEQGVNVLLGERVQRITKRGVVLSSNRLIPTQTTVWAVGVKANDMASQLDVPLAAGGRVAVNDDLSIPQHPEVFVVGDMAACLNDAGKMLPQLATVAKQQGQHAAKQIAAQMEGRETRPFHYKNPGSMAIVSRHSAVAELPGDIRLAGVFAWLSWLLLHVALLAGWHNKLHVVTSWICNYISRDRKARLILANNKPSKPQPKAKPIRLKGTQRVAVSTSEVRANMQGYRSSVKISGD